MGDPLRFTIDEAGERLDVFLSRKCLEMSRAHAQKIIADGGALVMRSRKRRAILCSEGMK